MIIKQHNCKTRLGDLLIITEWDDLNCTSCVFVADYDLNIIMSEELIKDTILMNIIDFELEPDIIDQYVVDLNLFKDSEFINPLTFNISMSSATDQKVKL